MCCKLLAALFLFNFSVSAAPLFKLFQPCGKMLSFLIKPCSTANQLEFYMILVQYKAFPSPLCNSEKMRQLYTSYSVNITSWPVIGAANMAAHCLSKI